MVNATGWGNITLGTGTGLVTGVFSMYDTAMSGWFIAGLFMIYSVMLWIKTKNLALMFISGIFFAALYLGSAIVKPASTQIILMILIFELAGIIYMWFYKG